MTSEVGSCTVVTLTQLMGRLGGTWHEGREQPFGSKLLA